MESGLFYGTLIDPILKPMRQRVASKISKGECVIDIACGTGAQIAEISDIASSVTGIDLSESMIEYAKKRNIPNSSFLVCDASDLSIFKDGSYNFPTLTMVGVEFFKLKSEQQIQLKKLLKVVNINQEIMNK